MHYHRLMIQRLGWHVIERDMMTLESAMSIGGRREGSFVLPWWKDSRHSTLLVN
jgi:hypothetical protein